MLTRAPAVGEVVDFAVREVTRLRRVLRNRLSSEEMPPHHHNNLDSSRLNLAALCAGLAPQSLEVFSARCSFQVWLMPAASAVSAAWAAAASACSKSC